MSFSYPSLARVTPFDELISFASSKPNRGAPYGKRQLRIGAAIVAQADWKEGERIIVGFGEPGTEHAGWLRAERSGDGILIKPRNKKTKSCVISFTHVAAWISQDEHGADRCPEWRIVDGAIEIKLPGWAVKPHTAERGDRPRAGKPKTGKPDNSSHAEAGGGESSGSTDAPPAEISRGADTARGKPGEKPLPAVRSSSRSGPEDGSDDLSVNAHAGNRLESRDALAGGAVGVTAGETAPISSSGPGEANGTTLKGEMAGHTGGEEEAATVAPPVRELDDGLTDKQRAVYAELVRAAEAGKETPRLIDLARAVGSEDPNAASYCLSVLYKMGLVRRDGRHADVTYHVVAIGKSTVPRALRRAPVAEKTAEKPAVASSDVAPVNGHFAQAVAEKPRRVTQPAPSGIVPVERIPDKAVAQIVSGPVTEKHVIAWLNDEARLTCHKLGSDNYLLGDEYVGWRHVIARANRMRRVRKEPEFTVA